MARLAALCLLALAGCALCAGAEGEGWTVKGRVVVPESITLAAGAEVVLTLGGGGGRRRVAFPLRDAGFAFPRVPAGEHTLEVNAIGLIFPTMRLEVGSGRRGITATLVDVAGSPTVAYPLILRPVARAEYFEQRQPFSLIAFVKTPYGLMIAFMIFSMVVLPRLKVDPEEYKAMLDERDKLSKAVTGGGGGERRRARSD